MVQNNMLPWAAGWLEAANQAAGEAMAKGVDGQSQGHLAVIALHNAAVAVRKCLGQKDAAVKKLDSACPDLKDARDMLTHFEDYVAGKGRLQEDARKELKRAAAAEGADPGRVPWLAFWGGSDRSQELRILTHSDASGMPTTYVVNIQATLRAVATGSSPL